MLANPIEKFKGRLKASHRDLFLSALVFLISMASFGLGRLSAIWPAKEPIKIDEPAGNDEVDKTVPASNFIKPRFQRDDPSISSAQTISSSQGNFVASKNGSSYHLPSCPGALNIKEGNKIWFRTKEEAAAAGYKPAGNCPGL